MKEKYNVTGMTCSACSSRVEKCVSKLSGVNEVSVNLLTGTMQVDYRENELSTKEIIRAVVAAGYGASLQGNSGSASSAPAAPSINTMDEQLKQMKIRIVVSFCFLIPLMYISMGHMLHLPQLPFLTGLENAVSFALTQFLLSLPIIYVNRKYYQVGFKTLFHGAPNMDTLIAIGSTAALIYGIFAIYRMGYGLGIQNLDLVQRYHKDLYFESATMILTLITLGKYLETRSKGKTSEALKHLMDLAPKTALVERNSEEIEVPVEEIHAGDIIIIKSGMRIPVDGFIIDGSGNLDESAITGESLPVQRSVNDTVISASICKTGYFRFKATRVGSDTTLSQIIQLVEDAGSSKAPIARLADKIAGIFVPVVITIAVLASIIWIISGATFEFALSIGISVLVISCPCALGLATPVAIMVGTGKGAENGILIKSGEALETAHNIDTLVLDKTGTITEGKPYVTDVLLSDIDKDTFLNIAYSLEKKSEHPLADAVIEYCNSEHTDYLNTSNFKVYPGKGVSAIINDITYYSGNLSLIQQCAAFSVSTDSPEKLAQEGKTPLFFFTENKLLGIIAVADRIKPTSKQAIDELKSMGIHVVMLTGDNKTTANAIQKQLSIPEVISEVLPQEKASYITDFQKNGKVTAMVGDGINDAPALACANVGIAIGAGTDVAIESADIVLMRSDLLDVVTAIKLSKAVIRNIRQNLFWAFFYNSVGIPLAAGVFYSILGWKLNPMFGAAAMSLSSVCVVSNALRLKFFKTSHGDKKAATDHSVQSVSCYHADFSAENKVNNTLKKGALPMRTITINGMMCMHCSGAVEKALNAVEGVKATVNLEAKTASVEADASITNEMLTKVITDAGYEVVSIQ